MEFAELIARARDGDPAAIEELFKRFSPAVVARLRGQLGPGLRRRYDTDDLGQSVFAEVLRDLPKFESDHEGAFRKWLNIKTQSKLWMKLRRHLDGQGQRREMTWDGGTLDGKTQDDPAIGAAQADEREKLERAMQKLTREERDLLTMRGREGLPYARIAEQLGLPSADAARMRHARAILRLKELFPQA